MNSFRRASRSALRSCRVARRASRSVSSATDCVADPATPDVVDIVSGVAAGATVGSSPKRSRMTLSIDASFPITRRSLPVQRGGETGERAFAHLVARGKADPEETGGFEKRAWHDEDALFG